MRYRGNLDDDWGSLMTSSRVRIHVPRDRIAELCRRNHIRRLAFFGSVLRDDFTPDSDVDVLVEFEPGKTPGFAFFSMEEELSEILGRRVDLNTPNCLRSCMSRRDDTVPMRQMLDHARQAVAVAKQRSRADLDSDWLLQLALRQVIQIVGEEFPLLIAALERALSERQN